MNIRVKKLSRIFCISLFLCFSGSAFSQRLDLSKLKSLSDFKGYPSGAIYPNKTLSAADRAKDVLKYLTFEEKLKLTGGFAGFCFPGVERLGLRAVTMADASQGIRLTSISSKSKSVSFPGMQALAATWNPQLATVFGKSIGEECIAHGVDILLGPGINMQRHSVGGRNYEYMGEDPLLTSNIAVGYVKGLQSQNVIATAKHFVANDQEFCRHIASSDVSERTLREIYLRPWEAVIRKAGVKAMMSGNNLVNSIPCSMHQPLLNDIIRKEFGFTGVSMTDWQNTNYYPHLQYLVAESGLSLLMSNNTAFTEYVADFLAKYPSRKAEMEKKIEQMIYPNLYTFFETGIYDRKPVNAEYLKKLEEHKLVAAKVAEEAICLLKNESGILPVARSKKILLTGSAELHSGAGSGFVSGYDHVDFEKGLKTIYTKVEQVEKPSDEQIKKADVVIYRLNKKSGEGRDIPFEEGAEASAAIDHLLKLNPNVIVLISSANGLPMPWLNKVKGVLWTFMLGQERGTALANILSGKSSPSGKIPFTIEKDFRDSPDPEFNFLGGKPYWHGGNEHYRDYWKGNDKNSKKEIAKHIKPQQLVHIPYNEGVFMGYRWYEKNKKPVLFPFGFGLSYTSFSYSNLKLSKNELSGKDSLLISLTLKNTGKVPAAEVVQLYISDKESTVERPVKELKAFDKVFLKPGESKKVQLMINEGDLAFWDEKGSKWKTEPGQFEVLIGKSSADIVLRSPFEYTK